MGFLRNFLSGKPDKSWPGDDLRPTEDWAVGDLAECIHDGDWWDANGNLEIGPKLGEINVCREIRNTPIIGPSFIFSRWQPRHFHHSGFRKITPKADAAERSETSFRDLVRRRSTPAAKPRELSPARDREKV